MRFLLEDKSLVCNQSLAVVEDKYLGRKRSMSCQSCERRRMRV